MNISNAAKQAAASEGVPEPQEHAREAAPEAAPQSGETHWAQASGDGLQRPAPKQYSELDESASSQEASNPSMEVVGKHALHDVLTSVDTDRGPVLEATYDGPVTGGHLVGDEEHVRGERDPAKSTSSKMP